MRADHATVHRRPRPIPDRALVKAGAVLAIGAGLLRLPASLLDPGSTGAAVEALYFAIDVSLLFALLAVYVADPSSRTTVGTLGFVVAAVGNGLLIGPEPADSAVDTYAAGAAAVTIGFAALAIAWRHSAVFSFRTRVLLLGTLVIGLGAGASHAALVAAGVTFSLALVDSGRSLLANVAAPDQQPGRADGPSHLPGP